MRRRSTGASSRCGATSATCRRALADVEHRAGRRARGARGRAHRDREPDRAGAREARARRRRRCRESMLAKYDKVRIAPSRRDGFSAARPVVQRLRYGDPDAAPRGHGRVPERSRCARGAARCCTRRNDDALTVVRRVARRLASGHDRVRSRARPRARWILPDAPDPAVVRACATSCCSRSRSAGCSSRAATRPPDDAKRICGRASISCSPPSSSSISIAPSSGSCARSATARRFSSTATTTWTACARRRCIDARAPRAGRQRSFRSSRAACSTATTSPTRACAPRARPARRSSSPATAARARVAPVARAPGARGSTSSSATTTCRAATCRTPSRCSTRSARAAARDGQGSRRRRRRVQARAGASRARWAATRTSSTACSTSSRSRRSPTSRRCAARIASSRATGCKHAQRDAERSGCAR